MTQQLDREILKKMIYGVTNTKPHEIDCDKCFEELDRFAEAKLVGRELDEALVLVEEHLERCKSCREEFEALMDALRAIR